MQLRGRKKQFWNPFPQPQAFSHPISGCKGRGGEKIQSEAQPRVTSNYPGVLHVLHFGRWLPVPVLSLLVGYCFLWILSKLAIADGALKWFSQPQH